ncbi:hypothetical protein Tco_0433073 [Tanacetum coccineum]
MMKEHGIKKSWHKELEIKYNTITHVDTWLPSCLIDGLNNTSILIAYDEEKDKLVAYCLETDTIEETDIYDDIFKVLTYRPSFLKLQNFQFEDFTEEDLAGPVGGLSNVDASAGLEEVEKKKSCERLSFKWQQKILKSIVPSEQLNPQLATALSTFFDSDAINHLGGTKTDLFSSSPSDPYSLDVLALVPVTVAASEPVLFGGQTFVAASSALASLSRSHYYTDGFSTPPQPTSAYVQSDEPPKPVAPTLAPANNFETGPSQTGFTGQPSQLSFQGGQPSSQVPP